MSCNFNDVHVETIKNISVFFALVGSETACTAFCRGFDPYRQHPRGVAVDFGPKESGLLINQLPQFLLNIINFFK